MSESRKRTSTSSLDTPNVRPLAKKSRPAIAGTKATQARAKAIKSQLSTSKPNTVKKRKPTAEDPNTPVKSYHTTASELKKRPAWDLRGKVSDMTELYKMNLERLEDLRKFKRELEILNDEKESQEKEALQKAAALRAEIMNIERNHATDVTDLHTNHRIEYQEMVDNSLIYSRKLQSQNIELSDAKNRVEISIKQLDQIKEENSALRESMDNTTRATQEAEDEIRTLTLKSQKLETSIEDREKEIQEKKREIEKVEVTVNALKSKLADSHAVRDRLLRIAGNLRESASANKRAVTKLNA